MANKNTEAASNVPSLLLDDDDDDDVDDNTYKHLSTEELTAKINMIRNLYLGNKINNTNAFDVDLIGCFSAWLKRKKETSNDDVGQFQDIADYLEASGKIYSCRVDNLSDSTNRLVEQFRAMNYKKNMIESEENPDVKVIKPKRSRLMLTTADKLKRKPYEFGHIQYTHDFSPRNYAEIFSSGNPARYMMSLFNGTTWKEEMEEFNKKSENVDHDETYTMEDMSHIFSTRVICPGFHAFDSKRNTETIDSEIQLKGIEHRFDPDIHQFSSLRDSNNDVENHTVTDSNEKESDMAGLLKCLDYSNKDYSFFNPKLLANWKGPMKAWKANAMLNALRSCNPSERKEMMSSSNLFEDIDEELVKNIIEPKSVKKRTNVVHDIFKVKWLKMCEIENIMKERVQSKEKLSQRTLQKWHVIDNICDAKRIIVDFKHKSEFLQYSEIQPEWWTQLQNTPIPSKEHYSKPLINNQNIDEWDETVLETFNDVCDTMPDKSNAKDAETLESLDNSNELHSDNDENIIEEFKTESNVDIGDLKQEIFDIIKQNCVAIDSKSEWSTYLSFSKLLIELNAVQHRPIGLVLNALLHLTNDHGLKLSQNIDSGDEEIHIAFPVNET